MRTLPNLLKKLSLMLVGVLLALVLAEVGVRLLLPQDLVTENLRYESHATVGFRMSPNTLFSGEYSARINNLGLRGADVSSRAAGEHRVLVLGDSFTYGAGVATEETMTAQLQLLQPGTPAAPWRFVNAGTPAYGTYREFRWLQAFGETVDPDEVLLAIFVGNDLTDNLDESAPRIVDGRMIGSKRAEQSDSSLRLVMFLRRFHLYRLILARTHPVEEEIPAEQPDGTIWGYTPEEIERKQARRDGRRGERFAANQSPRIWIYAPEGRQRPDIASAYERTEHWLGEIAAWCRARDIPLRVVIIPDVMQVEQELLERVLERSTGLVADKADFQRPQRSIAQWCQALGVPVLDLLPALRERTEASGESYYLEFDSHWNPRGHALAAEETIRAFYGQG